MRLERATVEGFRGFVRRAEIDLSADVIVLHGPNGAGKTSLLDAILWGLTGRVDRFAPTVGAKKDDNTSVVSLYSKEGFARVVLSLVYEGQHITVSRVSRGDRASLLVRDSQQELKGAAAESWLSDLLLPRSSERIDASSVLSRVVTRGVYLQQDLVRQFIDSDTPADRFDILSEVVGAGIVLELKSSLEKSRNQWARSISSLRAESLEPLLSNLASVNERLERLQAAGDSNAVGTITPAQFHDEVRRTPNLNEQLQ